MTQKFFGILTEIGEIKEANAHALGTTMRISHLAVCDGNGAEFLPDRKMTELPGEKRRAPINSLAVDSANPGWIIAEQVIPEGDGGYWIRGYGLIDQDGDLVAVANCPPTYKPQLPEGSGRTQVVRMVLMVGSVATYQLKIDPAVVLATRQYVDFGLAAKLDATGTAVAASKLETARSISAQGAATATPVPFDGTKNVTLTLDTLDMGKAASGILPVQRGGTGKGYLEPGYFLRGAGYGEVTMRAPVDVRSDIGAAPLHSPQFTGTPGTPTPPAESNSAEIASTAFVVRHTSKYIPWVTLATLPATDKGPVFVVERREIWIWVETTYYVGYRSPYCGRLEFGHTASPLPGQIDANGQWVTTASYGSLQAYAKENSLMVSAENWVPGAYVFAETGTGLRLPDLRNQFLRFTGVDVDGGTRHLASAQKDALQQIFGGIEKVQIAAGGSATSGALSLSPWNEYGQYLTSAELGQRVANLVLDASAVARTASETRPSNVAFHPRIHF
ncbi:hypothetical protein LMG26858_01668 [Achromobacter anxifer]|uniref:Phage tail fibre protein N-terminal domain-containing protein n=1 Tax=Achromobacter anxifer TaxID=1287737 RepID=A0A6S7CIQ6_9BURK|nr:phage tail protein [Achromobacter anxifer]CAB3850223.1 hypothetical protein LMG26858_01668 [Achromobacter anxifer]